MWARCRRDSSGAKTVNAARCKAFVRRLATAELRVRFANAAPHFSIFVYGTREPETAFYVTGVRWFHLPVPPSHHSEHAVGLQGRL